MADRYLIASGNSENPAIYDGGTFPSSSDVLRLNGFTWTVTANRTIAELRCDALAPAVATTASRSVILNNGVTLIVTSTIIGTAQNGLIGVASGGTANVICPLLTKCMIQIGAGETLNVLGNGDPAVSYPYSLVSRADGIVNWTGNLVNTSGGFIADGIGNGSLNIVGNSNIGSAGIWARGPLAVTVTGGITTGNTPFYDTTATTYPTFTHYGTLTATGTSPTIRSRSPYRGTGPFINNGSYCAFAGDRLELIGLNSYIELSTTAPSTIRMYTPSELTGYPAENKVEDGTVYGPSSEFEGTMEPWDAAFAQALATAQRDLQLPSILSAITAP